MAALVRVTDLAPGGWTRGPEDVVRPLFRDGQELQLAEKRQREETRALRQG
jgi:hypothetical protein